jgi:hypothetical protein
VLDPQLDEAVEINERETPLLLRASLAFRLRGKTSRRDEDADVPIAEDR